MVVIGIGNAGCNIASHFSKAHKKILIDADRFPSTCKKTEDYEAKCPAFKKELSFKDSECYVILCGAGKVAGASLRIMEKIKDKKINVVYICPDPIMINSMEARRHKVVFNVLQEYARSGLLNKLYLISNREMIEIAGEGPIQSVYESANKTIANIIETIEYFKSDNPVLGSIAETKEISRICTFSIGFVEKNEEKLTFLLDNITESCYIYSVSEEEIKEKNNLLSQIKRKISDDKENNIISSFAIFNSLHNQTFYYSIKCTHHIQLEEK